MGKRSSFARRPMDDYRTTDPRAVAALLPFLAPRTRFCEPCAGAGDLLDQLVAAGHVCARARDINPQRADIEQKDALTTLTGKIDCFITNPPWTRTILHPLITFLSGQYPTWLLFDADWAHTKQARPFMDQCSHIVAIGRLKWIPDSKFTGKDNCAWHRFDAQHVGGPRFFPQMMEATA